MDPVDPSSLRLAAATDVGHVRARNEDHAVVATTLVTGARASLDESASLPTLVAVLDGMGGHPAGDVASGLAASALADTPPPEDPDDVADVVRGLHDVLVRHMADHPETTTMGTTLVAATIDAPHSALVFGVGDSMAIWLDDEGATSLLPLDRSPMGGITQVLGGSRGPAPLDPHVRRITGPGRLALVTDGISDVVAAAAIVDALEDADLAASADRLVRAALDRGAPDNATVVLADLVPGPS